MGQFNKAGGTSTTLQTGSSGAALRVIQLHGSSAVRAEAENGRAVQALAGNGGTGVWAHSPDHYAVKGMSDTGLGIYGSSVSSFAAWFDGKVGINKSLDIQPSPTPDAEIVGARLFVRTNVAGKLEFCVRFSCRPPAKRPHRPCNAAISIQNLCQGANLQWRKRVSSAYQER